MLRLRFLIFFNVNFFTENHKLLSCGLENSKEEFELHWFNFSSNHPGKSIISLHLCSLTAEEDPGILVTFCMNPEFNL